MVRCSDGSLYTGVSKDLERRIEAHNEGRGAKYTYSRRPVELAYSEEHKGIKEALRREIQIKKLKRAKKEALIQGRSSDYGKS